MLKIGNLISVLIFAAAIAIALTLSRGEAQNSSQLFVAYPPAKHQTTSDRIFLIGTAPKNGEVFVNGKPIKRSPAGHFAPSLPLQLGSNRFNLRYQNQDREKSLNLQVFRLPTEVAAPTGLALIKDTLVPDVNIARLPNELICFEAIATPNAKVQVKLGDLDLALTPKTSNIQLPINSTILTGNNQAYSASVNGHYQGCTSFAIAGNLGKPEFIVTQGNNSIKQEGNNIEILDPKLIQIAEVIVDQGIARTGASSDFSRLTPLPKGTKDRITAKQGDWVRLSYGGWIDRKSVQIKDDNVLPNSIVRSLSTRISGDWTEIVIPLQVPVPISISQGDKTFNLTLHNLTAQTDTILTNDDPIISRLDWQQVEPQKVQYTIQLKSSQQWGYKLRYQGTTLIVALKHPPKLKNSLKDITILLDPGHGSQADSGSRGATGYPEKDVALIVSKLLRQELTQKGAKVVLTRNGDQDIYPNQRAEIIQNLEPAIALSLHYNALPDHGDAENTMGIGTFWYHPQSHDLAIFIHNYLVKNLKRPSYGVYWNNLALARPTVAPSVLLELGFMINPVEFEWITNPQAQRQLASSLANAIAAWLAQAIASPI